MDELEKIRLRYAKREQQIDYSRYGLLNPYVLMSQQEQERVIVNWIKECGMLPVEDKKVLEIGCGSGTNLIQLIRLGFRPENLTANELLPDRASMARNRLPAAVPVLVGDAATLELTDGCFDVVYQSTVFSSVLDHKLQEKLAARMWSLVKPGGGILWYDFIYDNPWNPDVKGVPLKRIRELFPQGQMTFWRVTLVPPVGRIVTRIHPWLYSFFNLIPLLRSHILCWIGKQEVLSKQERAGGV